MAQKLTHTQWYHQVAQAVYRIAGCHADDLADYCYRDAYDDGRSPVSTARSAVRNDKGLE